VVKNIQGLAPNAWIPTVEASPHDAGTAYVAADHHQDNDYTAYFFKTADYGKTWTRLNLGLPPTKTGWPHVIREDPKNKAVLYAGTELGLWVSFDSGARWTSLRQNLPPVPIRDLQIHPRDNDLIVATHGRGLYILDDITPLQQIDAALAGEGQLFDIRPATRWTIWNKDGNLGQGVWRGANPPTGAIISYYLKSNASDASVTVADKAGKVIRTIRNVPRAAGVNRATWDMQYDGPSTALGAGAAGGGRGGRAGGAGQNAAGIGEEPAAGGGGRFGGGGSPWALPGEYTITLHADGRDQKKTVTVEMDPRVPTTPADLQQQLQAQLTLRDLTSRANTAIDRANSLVAQLTALQERLKRDKVTGPLPAAVDAALASVTKLREDDLTRPYPSMGYRQYPRIREEIQSLSGAIARAPARPTDGEALRMRELDAELDGRVELLNKVQREEIGKINDMMKTMPFIQTETIR
jgi:uncharacterized membrane protein YgcG